MVRLGRGGGARVLGGVVGVAAIVGLVVAGAAADRPDAAPVQVLRSWPVALLGVVTIASLVVVAAAARNLPRLDLVDDGRRRSSVVGWLLAAAVLALVGGNADVLQQAAPAPAGGTVVDEGVAATPDDVVEPDVRLSPSALGIVALVAAAVVAGMVMTTGRGRAGLDAAGRPSSLVEPTAAARAALRGASDPRGAVIRAFAVFEASFDARGLGRDPSETQAAWVERVLVEQGAPPRPAARLRDRFERARFSRAPIDDADRTAALADLDELLGDRVEP